MCGVVGVFDLKASPQELKPTVLKMSKRVRHRGPDWSGIFSCEKAILAHERMSIVDPQSGRQPLYSSDKNLILAGHDISEGGMITALLEMCFANTKGGLAVTLDNIAEN